MEDTKVPVEELSGRELDAHVAEEVMGWRRLGDREIPGSWKNAASNPSGIWWETPSDRQRNEQESRTAHADVHATPHTSLPLYSTDIAAAWEVWRRLDGYWAIMSLDDGKVRVTKGWPYTSAFEVDDGAVDVVAGTAPEAICRAALLAVRSA